MDNVKNVISNAPNCPHGLPYEATICEQCDPQSADVVPMRATIVREDTTRANTQGVR